MATLDDHSVAALLRTVAETTQMSLMSAHATTVVMIASRDVRTVVTIGTARGGSAEIFLADEPSQRTSLRSSSRSGDRQHEFRDRPCL